MKYNKSELINIAKKVEAQEKLTPKEVSALLQFENQKEESSFFAFLGKAALPLSILLGISIAVFPHYFEEVTLGMPSWTNLSDEMLAGINFIWNILSDPVEENNILYHLPNIVLYSFGILGVKKLFDALDRKTWRDKVLEAQIQVKKHLAEGTVNFALKPGHSILFVGNGDYIGMQLCLNTDQDNLITISQEKPRYTDIWNFYSAETLFEDLQNVLKRSDAATAGEYLFFPVKDDQIFLPGPTSYDLSPHKLDILCQNIRTIEKASNWSVKRIIIIGDKHHTSFVESQDRTKTIKNSEDSITLESIAQKYENVTLLDPTDIVLQKIVSIAKGRKIVFRATREGIAEYKARFFERLSEMGYPETPTKPGILTIGYDLFEDQTEQQMLSRKIDDYFPVVLSKNVYDALIRNGYKRSEFLYVPDLVLKEVAQEASEQ
jgi:hypothetical protein